MAKKRRHQQSSSSAVVVNSVLDSTDSERERKVVCTHIQKATDLKTVRKAIIQQGGFSSLSCGKCKSHQVNFDALRLCLKCGSCNCEEHSVQHVACPHSDPHDISLQLSDSWTVWCYVCRGDISHESSAKLNECLSFLKRIKEKEFAQQKPSSKKIQELNNNEVEEAESIVNKMEECSINTQCSSYSKPLPLKSRVIQNLPKARGLRNLGNTCFFNSVLQCLAQTPFLLEMLKEMSQPGQRVRISIDEDNEFTAELEGWGEVTEQLATTLEELRNGSSNAYDPNRLLDALRKKCRQFIGYSQQDAHELLRQLLDSVKTEDIRRYQKHILQHFGLSRKENPTEMDEKKRLLAKALNQKLTEVVVICPDQVFKGTLVSTVQCTQCYHTSEVIENFLDLSLPVSFEKPLPPALLRKKSNSFGDAQTKSKHQKKKEQKAERREKKLGKRKQKASEYISSGIPSASAPPEVPILNEIDGEQKSEESGYSSRKTISPVRSIQNEENEILSSALKETISSVISPKDSSGLEDQTEDDTKVEIPTEFGINEATDTSLVVDTDALEVDVDEMVNTDLETDPATIANCTIDVVDPDELYNSPVGLDTNTLAADLEDYEDYTVPTTHLELIGSPEYRRNNVICSSSSSSTCSNEAENGSDSSNDANDERDEDEEVENVKEDFMGNRLKPNTLSAPYICSEFESSVMSCLNQFTALEILTGNNKVCCESCTEKQNKGSSSGSEKKKLVYQTSTKQLLISSPPPVLILHLKRFQGTMFSLKKVSNEVNFPPVLDISPFCSTKCEKFLLPNEKSILYSLYGIVVHSGGLYGGHYIAYVKVRPPVSENSYRRSFLPNGPPLDKNSFTAEDIEKEANPPSYWYYISDSMVRPTTEEEVLKSQAYLLFYERIA